MVSLFSDLTLSLGAPDDNVSVVFELRLALLDVKARAMYHRNADQMYRADVALASTLLSFERLARSCGRRCGTRTHPPASGIMTSTSSCCGRVLSRSLGCCAGICAEALKRLVIRLA